MEIVAKIVKYHSSLDRTNQSTAMIVFKIINHKTEEVQVAADMAEEAADMAEEGALVEEAALTEDHEKCTRLHVEIVAKIVKFHSNHQETSQSIAASVFKVIEETRIILV